MRLDCAEVDQARVGSAGAAGCEVLQGTDRGSCSGREDREFLLPAPLHSRPPRVEHHLLTPGEGSEELLCNLTARGEPLKGVFQLVHTSHPEHTNQRVPAGFRRLTVDECIYNLVSESCCFPLIEDGKPGGDAGLEGELPEHLGAEGMEGRDVCPEKFVAEAIPSSTLLLRERLPDADLHLCGCLLGEGQRKNIRDAEIIPALEQVDILLHQDVGLPGARSSGDALAPRVVEGGLLLPVSQSHLHAPPR